MRPGDHLRNEDLFIIELLLVLLADVSSNYSLKCTIPVTIRLLSSHPHVIRWFAEGNGIRCLLQVMSHFYDTSLGTVAPVSLIPEYHLTVSNLLQCFLTLSKDDGFVTSLLHILRFHRISESFNVPLILRKGLSFHHDVESLRIILR